MAECPLCFGAGGVDLRNVNAMLKEHLTDDELAQVEGPLDQDWMRCDECEGTGTVTDERARELRAINAAEFDQAQAKLRAAGRWPW